MVIDRSFDEEFGERKVRESEDRCDYYGLGHLELENWRTITRSYCFIGRGVAIVGLEFFLPVDHSQ